MSEWKKTSEELPPEGKYVIGKYNGGNWRDGTDQKNVNTVIVKMVKGLSDSDRQKMKAGNIHDPETEQGWCLAGGSQSYKRSAVCRAEDQSGNNLVPYNFTSFGPSSFFGQYITDWMFIPDL